MDDLFGIDEEDILSSLISRWEFGIPVCSPDLHKKQKSMNLLNKYGIFLSGDYLTYPSIGEASRTGELASRLII